jgi:hypothetical protein
MAAPKWSAVEGDDVLICAVDGTPDELPLKT